MLSIPIMGTLLILERVNTEESHKGKRGAPCPDVESPAKEHRGEHRVPKDAGELTGEPLGSGIVGHVFFVGFSFCIFAW